MILPYQHIKQRCLRDGLIQPWCEKTIHRGMSYGLSSAGYDVRIDQDINLAPGCSTLASIMERIVMPNDLIANLADKSTWAREFLAVQNTIIEPGWEGILTLELSNHGTEYVVIRKGSPIAQLVFMQLLEPTDKPYAGKYQNQARGPQPALYE